MGTHNKISDERKQIMIDAYSRGLSAANAGKLADTTGSACLRALAEHGIERRPVGGRLGQPRTARTNPASKACSVCKIEQHRDCFAPRARASDGLESRCRNCSRLQSKEFRTANPEKERERHRVARQANPEASRAKVRKSYHKHVEKRREARRAYRVEHLEEERRRDNEWRKAHPLIDLEYKARKRARKHGVEVVKLDYQSIVDRDGYVCHLCCKEVARDELSFDHKIPVSRGGAHTLENVSVAHYVCNRRKNEKIVPSGAYAEE